MIRRAKDLIYWIVWEWYQKVLSGLLIFQSISIKWLRKSSTLSNGSNGFWQDKKLIISFWNMIPLQSVFLFLFGFFLDKFYRSFFELFAAHRGTNFISVIFFLYSPSSFRRYFSSSLICDRSSSDIQVQKKDKGLLLFLSSLSFFYCFCSFNEEILFFLICVFSFLRFLC